MYGGNLAKYSILSLISNFFVMIFASELIVFSSSKKSL